MIANPDCPTCGSSSWKRLEERVYIRGKSSGNEQADRRLTLLFEVWVPTKHRFAVRFVLCRRCGFVCYSPRPSLADVNAKYQAIPTQATSAKPRLPSELDLERSKDLFQVLAPYLNERREILDFGGGRGALLAEFIERGFECNIVEYRQDTIPGVSWLGNRLEDIPGDRRFDVVMASHVFEHLAEPFDTALQLKSILRPNGLVFIEVPLEVSKGLPPLREPVTHINFFTPASLRVLLERAGFEVLLCERQAGKVASGNRKANVRAVARLSPIAPQVHLPGDDETRTFIGLEKPQSWVNKGKAVQRLLTPLLRRSWSKLRGKLFGQKRFAVTK